MCRDRAIDQRLYLGGVGHVGRDGRTGAELELLGECKQPIHAAGTKHELRPMRRKMPSGRLAKAARRVGNDDDLVLDVLVHLRNAHQSASLPYCSSVTCSSHVTTWPSCFSAMAMWLMAQFGNAPCQCFSPGSKNTLSPGRTVSTG